MPSIESLRTRLRAADAAYRAGHAVMSDAAFDALVAELRTVAPYAPELQAPLGGTALLSLDNAPAQEDLERWHAYIDSAARDTDAVRGYVVQPNIDGVALAVRYVNGTLHSAWTRSGRDALPLAKQLDSLPIQIADTSTVEIYGELWSDDHRQSTPAAALRRRTPDGRGLNFTAYGTTLTTSLETSTLYLIDTLGFDTPHTVVVTELQQLVRCWSDWRNGRSDLLRRWPTDGIVAKAVSVPLQRHLGSTAVAPRYALALK
jgi:DNA ligase (NAD+)